MKRLGPLQKKLMHWIGAMEYVNIQESTTPPCWAELDKVSMNEVGMALKRLMARGLIVEVKPGMFSLPGWRRPETPEAIEAFNRAKSQLYKQLEMEYRQTHKA